MSKWDELKHGSVVEFEKTPPGSWTRPGEKYKVSKGRTHVHYENQRTGGGTYDHKNMYSDMVPEDRRPVWKEHSHDQHSHDKNARHKAHAEDTLAKLGAGEEYKVKE